MALTSALSRFLLLSWCCQRASSQAVLAHVGEDCFLECWKAPGFCDYCGIGNACCALDDSDADKEECDGQRVFSGTKQHQCVKAAFLPGQQPPATDDTVATGPTKVTTGPAGTTAKVFDKAQCIDYMAETGCDWTQKLSCPNQPAGSGGVATKSDSEAYQCCCNNNLWRESASITDAASNGLAPGSGEAMVATEEKCKAESCAWTVDFSCPSAPAGSKGHASNDGSLGFKCCCILKASTYGAGEVHTFGNGNGGSAFENPTEFNVNAAIAPTIAPVAPVEAVSEIGAVTLAPTAAPDAAQLAAQAFALSHGGANVRVNDVSMVDTDFKPSGHHGPIHNAYTANNAKARKEGCIFGICADLNVNDPNGDAALQSTAHGVGVVDGVTNTLPSYDISVNADNKVNVKTIAGSVTAPVVKTATGAYVTAGQDLVVDNGDKYNAVLPADQPVTTMCIAEIAAGSTTITVASQAGFKAGDKIMIGGVEEKTIAGFGSLILDSPITRFFSAGTQITKVLPAISAKAGGPPAISAKAGGPPAISAKKATGLATKPVAAGGSSAGGSSAWSGANKGILIALAVLACICITLAAVGAAAMTGRKKKRSTTDREAYLKNDFIERQPVYHEVPPTEEDGLMKPDEIVTGVDMRNGIPDAVEQPQVYLQPTNSFPLQTQSNAISFPGMPPIGGSMLLQPTAGSTYMSALPQGASMQMTTAAPYQNYASQPVYTSAPAAYSQQLGMTVPGAMLPQTTSMFQAQPQTSYPYAAAAAPQVMREGF